MAVYDVEIQHYQSGRVRNAGIMKAIDALILLKTNKKIHK